jgi:hypothetical protein
MLLSLCTTPLFFFSLHKTRKSRKHSTLQDKQRTVHGRGMACFVLLGRQPIKGLFFCSWVWHDGHNLLIPSFFLSSLMNILSHPWQIPPKKKNRSVIFQFPLPCNTNPLGKRENKNASRSPHQKPRTKKKKCLAGFGCALYKMGLFPSATIICPFFLIL